MGKMKYAWIAFAIAMTLFGLSAIILGAAILVSMPDVEGTLVERALYLFGGVAMVTIGFAIIVVSYDLVYEEVSLDMD